MDIYNKKIKMQRKTADFYATSEPQERHKQNEDKVSERHLTIESSSHTI